MNTHKLGLACLLVTSVGARAAHADPDQDNLRIGVQCAEYLATPDHGLQVTIDGEPRDAAIINYDDVVGYTRHGNEVDMSEPTDAGFDVAPGHHRLVITAPDCLTETRDLDIAQLGATFVSGRLALARDDMKGTVGAPNFIGFTIGGFADFRPAIAHGTNDGVFGDSTYSMNSRTITGLMLSTLHEHHHFVLAIDTTFGYSSANGVGQDVVTQTTGTTLGPPSAFTQQELDLGLRVRIGARLPMHDFALAAGTGLGGDADIETSRAGMNGDNELDAVHEADSANLDFYIPVWAAATYKPGCNWGVQALASYDVHPTDLGSSSLALGVGLLFQSSDACSEPEIIQVR